MTDTSLYLRNQPMFKCCHHCKKDYCPEFKGHYSKCPDKMCEEGHTEIVSEKV